MERDRCGGEKDVEMRVRVGGKREIERCRGEDETWSSEAMVRGGKAVQGGKSHYWGTSLERAAGIEPASLAWKARVLPLHNARSINSGTISYPY